MVVKGPGCKVHALQAALTSASQPGFRASKVLLELFRANANSEAFRILPIAFRPLVIVQVILSSFGGNHPIGVATSVVHMCQGFRRAK